jgi:hypothetical protein
MSSGERLDGSVTRLAELFCFEWEASALPDEDPQP